jgi:hypothetical protein
MKRSGIRRAAARDATCRSATSAISEEVHAELRENAAVMRVAGVDSRPKCVGSHHAKWTFRTAESRKTKPREQPARLQPAMISVTSTISALPVEAVHLVMGGFDRMNLSGGAVSAHMVITGALSKRLLRGRRGLFTSCPAGASSGQGFRVVRVRHGRGVDEASVAQSRLTKAVRVPTVD